MENKILIEQPNITYHVKTDDKFKTDEIFYTAFEPKLTNRFLVIMGESKETSLFPSFVIKSIDRPSYVVGLGWQPIHVWMYDPITPSTAQTAFQMIVKTIPLFNTYIKLLGPVGDTVESWILEECKITTVDFGTLDWSVMTQDALQIRLVMTYNNAILKF